MKPFDTTPLAPAQRELEAAERCLAHMRAARSFRDYESYWKSLLSALEKSWQKMRAAEPQMNSRFAPWLGKQERFRKSDPLLQYLNQARDADHHGLDPILRRAPRRDHRSSWAFDIALKDLVANRRKVAFGREEAIEDLFTPKRVELLPVRNRGRTYPIPGQHNGRGIKKADPVGFGALGIEFYSAVLAEAMDRFQPLGS